MGEDDIPFNYNQTYYKVTNKKECHHGYQYKNGLNIDKQEFNDDPEEKCGNGLYFTDKENIKRYLNYGIYIRKVYVPVDALTIGSITKNGKKYRANKIVLGKKYNIWEFSTIKKFDLNNNSNDLAYIIKKHGTFTLDIFNWIYSKNNINNKEYGLKSIIQHVLEKDLCVINWLEQYKEDYYPLYILVDYVIIYACKKGRTDILEKLYSKKDIFGLENCRKEVWLVCFNQNPLVMLDWLLAKRNDIKFIFDDDLLDKVISLKLYNIIDWYYQNKGVIINYELC